MGESSGPAIKELLKELRRDKVRIYTSIVTIQEVSVQSFRKGTVAVDNYTKVNKLARIHGITKEIALTAAKLEAQVLDATKPKDREENRQRKWDCFHLATAMELGCRAFYSLDEKQLKRGERFCTGIGFAKPAPRGLTLPLAFPEPEIEAKTNGKDSGAHHDAIETTPEPLAEGKVDATPPEESHQLEADPAHPPAVQGRDSGRAQGEAAGEGSERDPTKEIGKGHE